MGFNREQKKNNKFIKKSSTKEILKGKYLRKKLNNLQIHNERKKNTK